MSLLTSSSNSMAWVIDSYATDHMTYCPQLFSKYIPSVGNRKICITDSTFLAIATSGTVRVSPTIALENVLYVPNISCNLFVYQSYY